MHLYFAYGSNLDENQMKKRCPGSDFISKAVLKGHRIDFTRLSSRLKCGVADVLPDPSQDVWGILWKLTNKDFETLDEYEGHPTAYTRFQSVIGGPQRNYSDVWVYTVVHKQSFVAPSKWYLRIIQTAAIKHGFPESYCSMLNTILTQ